MKVKKELPTYATDEICTLLSMIDMPEDLRILWSLVKEEQACYSSCFMREVSQAIKQKMIALLRSNIPDGVLFIKTVVGVN